MLHPNALNIVIPARNEEANITTCLTALIEQTHPGPVRIVVIPNGCTDSTAAVVRSFLQRLPHNYSLVTSELPTSSKAAALNAGDRLTVPGHRIYLDADAVLSATALADMSATLDAPNDIHLCAPARHIKYSRSWITRCYKDIWSSLPYIEGSVIFSGVYAVSIAGRSRWDTFPQLHSDDKFVRLHFAPDACSTISTATSTIRLPVGLRRLFSSRVRWCRGNIALRRAYPHLVAADQPRYRGIIRNLVSRTYTLPAALFFCALHSSAFLWAHVRLRPDQHSWSR